MEKNMDSIDEHRFGKFQEKGVHFLEESALQMKTSYDDFSMADFRTRKTETCGCQDLLNSSEKIVSYKGKEIVVFEDHNEGSNVWVERDFLQLNECRGNSSKRVADNEDIQAEKKRKPGTLNLSSALPDGDLQSLDLSNNNKGIGYFRNGSLSSCYSHPFSHNLSYSLAPSSKEDSESAEGLNWISSSDSNSFFLFELPARPTIDGQFSVPERILGEIVSESIPLMAQIVEDLPDEVVESTTEYLRSLIASPYKKDLLVSLQNRLTRRSDLTVETLSKCNKTQLEILVAIKMSLGSFLSFKTTFKPLN
ncbi:hypothetical protein K7X08_001273 [Anisodus acutangulus]|uniref:Uncharacterized protein n=1 Tax=Anisodus acutangulus TaxID=402998 RepID=A0A9Q1MP34_9SOLA|nr:hypothetical protein K7X08_001273 [Anisodus acutangulus]